MVDLKDITPEMRRALVEALENGGTWGDRFKVPASLDRWGLIEPAGEDLLGPWRLTPAGRIVAELLKENAEEHKNFVAEYKAHCETRRKARESERSIRQAAAVAVGLHGHQRCAESHGKPARAPERWVPLEECGFIPNGVHVVRFGVKGAFFDVDTLRYEEECWWNEAGDPLDSSDFPAELWCRADGTPITIAEAE